MEIQKINNNLAYTTKTNNSQKNQYAGLIIGGCTAAIVSALHGKKCLRSLPKTIPFYMGPGLIVDYLNNRQRKNAALNSKMDNSNKVNRGKKYGAVLGILTPLVFRIFNKNSVKSLPFGIKLAMFPFILISYSISALGGHFLGTIADKLANKMSERKTSPLNKR